MPVSRRTVTVLFCDVVGWTSLGASLDPEVLRERQTEYHTGARRILEHHGASVEKFIGDAVMAVFGWPRAHEDDALRAVRAAAELRGVLPGLQVRIGINTGEVAAGAGDALVTGDAVNLAKRLEQAADTDSVLIGAATRALVEGAVELEALPPVWLKGVPEPVEAWRLGELVGDGYGHGRRLDSPFVGRSRELERLRVEVEAAQSGCRIVTVVGAPGVGKSRLALELATVVGGDVRVLTGRCLSYGEGITFWPLEEIVRAAGGDPGLLTVHGDRVFSVTRRFFEELAADGALLLVVEDIHWAEPTLLDLLEYLAGWSEAPILLLCLARSDLFDRRPDWPRETVIALEPLTRAEADELVARLGIGLDEDVRSRIGEVADGNPLFVEQLAAAAAEGQVAVPPTLQALLADRLDRLSDDERAVLERAAVVGQHFAYDSVAALAADVPDLRVRSLLLGLVRKEVIRPGGEDGFGFRHILIREAAYASIPKRMRARLHAQVAGLSAGDELRGYHFEQAHRYTAELGARDLDLAAQAADALGTAGTRAYDRSDMPAALNLLERALAIGPGDDPARAELSRRHAMALLETGELARAREGLDDAIDTAARLGDQRVEWMARLDAAVHRGLAAPDMLAVAREAIVVFEQLHDEAGLAHAWRRVAVASLTAGSYGEAERAAELALEYAQRAGDAHQAGRAVDQLCTALLYGPAPADEAARRCRELVAEAGADGDPLVEANVLSSLAGLEAMLGRFDDARALAAHARASFHRLGLRRLEAGLAEIEGETELLADDPAAAEQAFRRGRDLVSGLETRTLSVLIAESLLRQGRTDEAARLAADAGELLTSDVVHAWVRLAGIRARLLRLNGEHDAALAQARSGVELASRTDALSLQGDALAALAEVANDDAAAQEAVLRHEAKRNHAAAGRVRRALLLRA
jgi:class 3 adenylate cyclase